MSQNLDTKRIQLTQSSKNHRVTSWSIAICKLGPGTGGGARAWLKNRSRWKLKRLTHLRDISFKFVKITEIKRIKTTTGLYKAAMPLMPLLLHLHLLQLWEDLCQALNDRNNAAPGDRGHCGNSHQDMTHMAMEKMGWRMCSHSQDIAIWWNVPWIQARAGPPSVQSPTCLVSKSANTSAEIS